MLTRRRFLGYSTAGATAVAIPTVIVPKVQAALATETPTSPSEDRIQRRIKMVHQREVERLYDEEFATALQPGSMSVASLWRPAGHPSCLLSSSIRIEKEIWLDICGRWRERRCQALGLDPATAPELPLRFVNFHLFNYIDPTQAYRPGWSGCRTHAYKEPYLSLRECLDRAIEFKYMALKSKDWVPHNRTLTGRWA